MNKEAAAYKLISFFAESSNINILEERRKEV